LITYLVTPKRGKHLLRNVWGCFFLEEEAPIHRGSKRGRLNNNNGGGKGEKKGGLFLKIHSIFSQKKKKRAATIGKGEADTKENR